MAPNECVESKFWAMEVVKAQTRSGTAIGGKWNVPNSMQKMAQFPQFCVAGLRKVPRGFHEASGSLRNYSRIFSGYTRVGTTRRPILVLHLTNTHS